MNIDLISVIHFYVGQWFVTNNSQGQVNAYSLEFLGGYISDPKYNFQLIARRKSSITEDEQKQLHQEVNKPVVPGTPCPSTTRQARELCWYIERGFWIFGDEHFGVDVLDANEFYQ